MRTGSAIALAFVLAAGIAARAQEIEPITFDPTDGKWILLQARIDAHAPMLTACALASACRAGPAMEQWHTLVGEAARRRGTARLAYVNAAVNRIVHWRSDHDNYGLDDYWAMPIETLMRGGDCEDFAILKFWILKTAGVDPAGLRLLAVVRGGGEAHMVLTATADDETWVLDDRGADLVPAALYPGQRLYALGIGSAELYGTVTRIADLAVRAP